MNAVLYVLLAICTATLIHRLRRKEILLGLVTSKNISACNRGLSYVHIMTKEHGDVLLAFDAYAKIGCRHLWFFGRSQCFHGKGLELDTLIHVNGYIKVKIEEWKDSGAVYVYRIIEAR